MKITRRLGSPAFAILWAFACCYVSAPSLASAQGRRLELADLTAEPPLAGHPAAGLAWRPHTSDFSWVVRRGEGEDGIAELWLDSAETPKGAAPSRRMLISTATLKIPEDPRREVAPGVERQPSRPARRMSLDGYIWAPDGQSVLVTGDHDLWMYRLPTGPLERLTNGPDDENVPAFSPDGSRVAFVRKNDLYVMELATRSETRLTSDGSETVFNGRLDWVYEEELASRKAASYSWSPDGRAIACLRLDDGPVPRSPIVDYLGVPAAVAEQRYPFPGGANPGVSIRVLALDGHELAHWQPERDGYIVPGFAWTRDSRAVAFRALTRAQNHLDLRLLDASGGSRVLLYEDDAAWINVLDPPVFLAEGRYLWRSERSGFAHLYVGSLSSSGGDLKPVTRGDWMVDKVGGVDDKKGLVYFSSTEGGVTRRGLHRVRLDGKGLASLASTPGTHAPELSTDGRFLLDTASTYLSPASISLLDVSYGDPVKVARSLRVVYAPETRLSELALGAVEWPEVPAEDGARLQARLVKPPRFDPARKYPVVVYVYGGPQAQVVRDEWTPNILFDRLLADRGYLVWSLDNRGSWGRGHPWEAPIDREMGQRELADQLAGVGYLKTLPYVDGARIAIWGGSYGGYMTLYALTNSPQTWKCGVAHAPVTDWKFYDSVYTERYMKTPADNAKGYEAASPLAKAARLRAPVLLLHGTADDNVHIQNTLAFVDALVKAGRPYELQLTPGQKHGFRGKAALDSRYAAIVRFFEKNL